jgi:hypothetical protein
MKLSDSSRFAIHNKKQLLECEKAGCYYCKQIFNTANITDYLKDGNTAVCPECGIDCVIAETSGFEITPEELDKLHKYWFK